MTVNAATKTNSLSIRQLEDAFATFNEASNLLGSHYQELESKVGTLNQELAATRSERLKELTAKEKLAAKLSTLMQALPGGVIVLNSAGLIIDENPAAIKIMNKNCQGQSWLQALQSIGVNELIFTGEISISEHQRISISSSVYGENGEQIILLNDVSQSYLVNALLNRDKRLSALGEMAARLAHQIRTPLSSAILNISQLTMTEQKNQNSTDISNKILARLRQIEKLVDGMLSYIRGNKNEYERFCLSELITEVIAAMELPVQQFSAKLSAHGLKQSCVINGNREALFNALSNLIDNALEAAPELPCIEIHLKQDGDKFLIEVIDDGPGISDSIKEQVFDPFFSTRKSGTGLGLAVVLSAVKAHNGEVFINTTDNGDTRFQLSLPDNLSAQGECSGLWGKNSHVFAQR